MTRALIDAIMDGDPFCWTGEKGTMLHNIWLYWPKGEKHGRETG